VRYTLRRLLVLLAVLTLVIVACGDDEGEETTTTAAVTTTGAETTTTAVETTTTAVETTTTTMEPVTIRWWHIQNSDPGLTIWQNVADEFTAEHPNVTIEITVQENEAFKSTLQTNLQAGDPPDLFQSWGGGGLAEQVAAGFVQDITAASAPWIGNLSAAGVSMFNVDGVQYGAPFDLGAVGFFYNTALFAEAGITAPPTTWEELLTDVQMLKDAGITPISVAAGDKWPAMFWWAYLSLRIGGADALAQAVADGSWDAAPFVQAGVELKRLIDMEPFQAAFLAAPWDGAEGSASTMANRDAAMLLMGQWAPGTIRANSADGTGIDDVIGWFPFPTVEGGAGVITDVFGGGNGFVVGINAPPETVDFLEYISSLDVATRLGESGGTLPVVIGSEGSVTDPQMAGIVDYLSAGTYMQLYLDQVTRPDVGAAINDAVQTLFAGTATPEEVAGAIAAAAGG
jgi:raffinose/stachyose/melibiose transport system substrate-binding protein